MPRITGVDIALVASCDWVSCHFTVDSGDMIAVGFDLEHVLTPADFEKMRGVFEAIQRRVAETFGSGRVLKR